MRRMFRAMVKGWFEADRSDYNDFVKALLTGDVDAMNEYMNYVAFSSFSYFDTGKGSSGARPEKFHSVEATTMRLIEPNASACFYHEFVLGLLVELKGRYRLTSNRESGFGRYDVMLEPLKQEDDAMILEFKVFNPRREQMLEDTVQAALKQIGEKDYAQTLFNKGIKWARIRKYGFAFEGKQVLIGEG